MGLEQTITPAPSWSELTGVVLPGAYEIAELVAADPQNARFRVRVLGDWSANAFVDVFALPTSAGAAQLANWAAAQQIPHPNLSTPLTSGELNSIGLPLVYVVANSPDETLAGLLEQRPATPAEAQEFLQSVRAALAHLHGFGWTHGHLCPEEVFAFGDSIRLSTEHILPTNAANDHQLLEPKYVAPEASQANVTPAADIWCLGATLFEALTQHKFSVDRSAELASLPEPFDRVVARCLDPDPQTRCTLAEIDALLAAPAPHPAAITISDAPVTAKQRAEESVTPILTRPPVRPEPKQTGFPRIWLYAAGVLILACLVLWSARARHRYAMATAPAVPPAPTSTLKQDPAAGTASQPTPVPPANSPQVHSPIESRSATTVSEAADHTINGSVWRVILFTYARQSDAEKKAQSVNQKHPQLDASVFKPSGAHSAYLVTVGGRMTRDQAARLRQRVIGLGMPRDSYIQNYKQ